ncbi:hypothetical protein ACJJTC_007499 [Scirpophaga incertulas]
MRFDVFLSCSAPIGCNEMIPPIARGKESPQGGKSTKYVPESKHRRDYVGSTTPYFDPHEFMTCSEDNRSLEESALHVDQEVNHGFTELVFNKSGLAISNNATAFMEAKRELAALLDSSVYNFPMNKYSGFTNSTIHGWNYLKYK